MRLTLTVVDPRDGSAADVVLDADPESPVDEVARALESRLTGARATSTPPVYVGGRAVDPSASLARSPLTEGAVVSLHTPAGCLPGEVTGIVELRVSGGPDAGAVHRLGLGRTDIGSGPAAHVRVDDPELAERALTVTVRPDGGCAVCAHQDGDRITLDGLSLGEFAEGRTDGGGPVQAEWPLDAQLAIAGTLLELVAYTPPDAVLRPSEDGAGFEFERPRRLPSPEQRRGGPPVEVRDSSLDRLRRPFWDSAPWVLAMFVLVTAAILGSALDRWYLLGSLLGPVTVVVARYLGPRYREQERTQQRETRDARRAELMKHRNAAPSPAAVLSLTTGPRARLWERRPGDRDHLLLRVGTGPDDVDLPVTLPLGELGVIGLAGPGDSARALGRWAVAQIAGLHSPLDVAVHVLTVKGAHDSWDWLKWLPHARPAGGVDANAAVGTDAETVGARIGELVRFLHERKRDREAGGDVPASAPGIVVVCDGFRRLRSFPGVVQLLREGPSVGIHLLCLDEEERFLPDECRAVVSAEPHGAPSVPAPRRATTRPPGQHAHDDPRPVLRLRVDSAEGPRHRDVRPDLVSPAWCARLARSLAPLRDASGGTGYSALPERTRLLDVLRLEPPTARAVAERWTAGGPSTFAVIGETYDGPFGVDLRRDGPHALVAGTAGSGKTELLQTFIASLALANSPADLTFVLVDYRGGSAFKECVRLPHTVGMVTDLDRYLVQRVLDSFGAELRRRERLVAVADARDIEEYQRFARDGRGDLEPLPRLVVVVDEIASIVRDLPDFVSGVLNVAQRGRSLGVHLVLATQRPSGVVSAEIRANTNLRIALRVTDGAESQDIVDSPEAARIPRSAPGRGYARLGHSTLIPFQAGRVGGRRPGTAGAAQGAPWTAPLTWQALGRAALVRPSVEPDGDAVVSDLGVLVDAVRDARTALGVPPQHSPLTPPLPEVLSLDDIDDIDDIDGSGGSGGSGGIDGVGAVRAEGAEPAPGALSPVPFGIEDLPEEQRRRPVTIDFARFRHLLIAGASGSGRSQALRTIAGALARAHSPADVHLYGIDCGHNGLAPLAALPHCGALVTRREAERAARLVSRLTDELRRRQDVLAEQAFAGVSEQRAGAGPRARLPHLVVFLDGWEGWLSTFGEYDHGRLTDEVHVLMREGASAGIHLVVTGDRQLLSGRMAFLTEDKYALRLVDGGDYALLGVKSAGVPERMPAGRALRAGRGTETQFALLAADPADQAQAEALAAIGAAARGTGVPREPLPFRVDALPGRISFDEALRLRDPEASRSPLWALAGVGGDELTAYGPDLGAGVPAFVVAGPPRSGRSTALLTLARSLLLRGTRLVVAAPRPSPLRELVGRPGVLRVFTGADLPGAEFEQVTESASVEHPVVVLADDAEVLRDCDAGPSLKRLLQRGAERGLALVIGGDEEEVCSGFSGWQVEAKKARRGLLLSPQDSTSGDLIGCRIARSAVGYPVRPGRGLLHLGQGGLRTVLIPADPDPPDPAADR
ncbi:FtsK/SpoIIIE domain-containing protein [Streptomyces sp. NPDC008313]|uniref:FtsK/SpoIIIE domain-containing protein n=1 Tax=Streptomyces sp. NPDC008313 TaxID=3364826 RepID=UPI0036E67638